MSNKKLYYWAFQDDFYNLLEKYGVKEVNGYHLRWNEICNMRNIVYDFIESEDDKTKETKDD